MNYRNIRKYKSIRPCPKCGRDSGRRMVNDDPSHERFYVRCDSCGFTVGAETQCAATLKWERLGQKKEENK